MTTLIEDLQALLTGLAPAGGVWYGVNTSQPAAYPYIVWLCVVSPVNNCLRGPTDLQNTRIQVDIYSRDLAELGALAQQVDTALLGSGITVIALQSQDVYESDVRAQRRIQDYSVWARN